MSHLGTNRNPMSEARRQAIHGDLIGLPDKRTYRKFLGELAIVGLLVIVATFAIVVVTPS